MPYLLRRPLLAGVFLLICFLAIRRALVGPPAPPPGDISFSADGRGVVLRGKVAGPPQRFGRLMSYEVEVSAWRESPWGPFAPAGGRVRATVPGAGTGADWGDEALFWGRLQPLRGPSVPGAYDEAAVSGERRIFCKLTGRFAGVQVFRPAGASSWLWWVTQARRRFTRAFARLGPEARAITAGLVLGDRPSGFPAMKEDFRRSGTIHLLVASGTNVAFILSLWWVLGRWVFFLSRRMTLLAGVPLAFFYAFLAGADAPVLRASVMSAVGIAGLLMGRVDRVVHAVGAAALILLLLDPGALFQAGFQMSFAATLGLALGMPAVEAVLRWIVLHPKFPRWKWARPALTGAVGLLAASFLSQLALSPLLIHYFRTFSLVGPLANMFAVPWGGVCLLLGAGLFALDLLGCPAVGVWAFITEKAALLLWKGSAAAGRWPGAEVSVPWTGLQVASLAAAVVGTMWVLSGVRPSDEEEGWTPAPMTRRQFVLLAGIWAAGASLVFALRPRSTGSAVLLWPSAGDAVAAVAADGGGTVVDPASPAQVRFTFVPFMRQMGARPRRLLFTRPPKKGGEALRAFAAEFPEVELSCAFVPSPGSPCRALADGAAWEEAGWRWEWRKGRGLTAVAGAGRFLWPLEGKAPVSPGPWDAVTLHPRGDVRLLRRRFPGRTARLWVVQGRGGAAWEASIGAPVHRLGRDGYLLWRGGRWERGGPASDVIK